MVELIARNFVPVALNADRLPDDADGRFFRDLMKRWPQGLWVVTPDGKTLAFDYHKPDPKLNYQQNQKKWLDGTRAMLEAGIREAGTLEPRAVRTVNPFPDRGLGRTQDGGARLAVTVVGLRNGKPDGPPAVDSLTLTKDEWSAFTPPAGQAEWALPESAGKKFAVTLSPLTDSIFVPRPKDVTTAEVKARVLREGDGVVVVRLTGRWESKHFRDNDPKFPITATSGGEGIAVYDSARKEITSVLFVLNGTYANGSAKTPTGAVVEWQAAKPE